VVISKMVDLSDLGLFIVGERGRGKGAVLNAVKQLRHRKLLDVRAVTPAGLAKIADELSGQEITFICPDITGLYTAYIKEAAINVLAFLISEHGIPQSWTGRYSYQVTDCTISFIAGVQPRMLRELSKLPDWESMYKDRFLRACLFYPFGTPKYTAANPVVGDIYLPTNFKPENVTITTNIKESESYQRLKTILMYQTSEGRCGQYLDRLLKASAFLNQRELVIKEDLEFFDMLAPYFLIDYWLSEREAIAAPLRFEPNAYSLLIYIIERGEVSRKEMRAHFKVSQSTISRAIEPLKEKHIIIGVYGEDKYHLNPEWYEKYILPLVEFGKKIDILKTGVQTTL